MASNKSTSKHAASPSSTQAASEGEPQTMFIPPQSGGSYVRNGDGSLTLREKPTEVPAFNPVKE